jgi:hypothetical protein
MRFKVFKGLEMSIVVFRVVTPYTGGYLCGLTIQMTTIDNRK